ncbi:NAD(P)/FAD-dependent oxidoreductase [Geodermatophilus sp. YIM 151500]|uniref:NAD(P)/FAD-dependent oxidoreductase n=1 Tax=Geodermatophilus sp. YIM 151500 TaxID=2984531 RepID=UPI0021E4FD8C|nr:NAD(P)/FAD-dependent oxidoreductase [Geodermatophilus sp. YIM 151500]MCV2488301.1 NAD(P)/FAD-dependent oxidoreductase [Geodermatophilus sp. YIM 151500]
MSAGRDAHWDVAVVGAGTAGLAAATEAAGAGLDVAVFDQLAPGGQLVNLTAVHGVPGFTGSGPDLMARLVERAEAAGVAVRYAQVTRVHGEGPLRLDTADGEITADAVVVATGLGPGRLGLPGEAELAGRGVSTCAGCDGPLFRGAPVAVVGDDEWTAEEALELAGLASAVTVLVPGEPRWSASRAARLAAVENVEVLAGASVVGLRGEGVLSGVVVRTVDGERELTVRGVFPYVGRRGPEALVEGLPVDGAGRLVAEQGGRTAVRNLFVAGDARAGAVEELPAAEADGAAAGRAAVAALRSGAGPTPAAAPPAGGLRVVDPTHGVPPADEAAAMASGGTADWSQVALFSNSKPNATELLQGLGARLQEHWALPELGFASKPNASVAADKDTIDWLSERFKMVLVAVGD